MKYQTNKELGPFINHWGCYFCSILEKVEKANGWNIRFSNELVVHVYKLCMSLGYISKEIVDVHGKPKDGCTVLNPKMVYNLGAKVLGVKTTCFEVRKESFEYHPWSNEEEILKMVIAQPNAHFVAGDGNSKVEFDPWEGGSLTARIGHIDSKRIFKVV